MVKGEENALTESDGPEYEANGSEREHDRRIAIPKEHDGDLERNGNQDEH